LRKLFIRIRKINIVNGSYEFILYLNRLKAAYDRFEKKVFVLNATIISIAIYALAELLGIPALADFYWQDFLPFAASPAIVSIILGAIGALIIRRKQKSDLFPLLGPQLSEKARTAYDNREMRSLPMQSLAIELTESLSRIKPAQILNQRRINSRVIAAVALSLVTILIAQSQISADITPDDLQPISDLRDKALGMFQNELPKQETERINLTGNIYGKPSLAVLNEARLELTLHPGTGAGSIARNTKPTERIFLPTAAGEAAAVPSELYIESLPPENKEIIKKYFEILAKS
jgi:hypothetical protein